MADTDSGSEYEVGEILGERKSGKKALEFLVRWKGFGESEDSWEKASNLKSAQDAIDEFRNRTVKKSKRKSSASRSRSRSRTRSKSRSPARGKKGTSPTRRTSRSRRSVTATTTKVSESPGVKEETKETITQAPGRFERKTATVTFGKVEKTADAVPKFVEPQRATTYTRTIETVTKTGPSRSYDPNIETEPRLRKFVNCCLAPVESLKKCCGGLVRSDYPALVVFATVTIITLSFVLEKYVNFERVWEAVAGFFASIWLWLTSLVSAKTD